MNAETIPNGEQDSLRLLAGLSRAEAYPNQPATVEILETHISWIFLAGDHAYKIKKGVRNGFLDYSSLAARRRYCIDEVRINRQYAPDLYLDVVPVTASSGQLVMEGDGEPLEFAVKMRRFDAHALLSDRLDRGTVEPAELESLAARIAEFHGSAKVVAANDWRIQSTILGNAIENLIELQPTITGDAAAMIRSLQIWTRDSFEELETIQQQRFADGMVRECHGDMHAGNIVSWQGRYIPFDGIEFNDSFRCIDVLNDLAFLSMDLLARGQATLRHTLVNAYLELTADRNSLRLLRWYEVYRALVRAKVAHMRWQQLSEATATQQHAAQECLQYIHLAHQLAEEATPVLTITHGPSGSGKSFACQRFARQLGAIQLRADVERKRMFGLKPTDRPNTSLIEIIYSHETSAKLYSLLMSIAERILSAGYSVAVDATFLKLNQRRMARELAARLGVEFSILDCDQPEEILRQRVSHRQSSDTDASDADLQVLAQQLQSREPLTDEERMYVT